MKAFVLLSANLDAKDWKRKFAQGETPDAAPYGYNFAQEFGCNVCFSQQFQRGFFLRLIDHACKFFLGFELTHTFRNLKAIDESRADIIWTHTEREFLPLFFAQTFTRSKCIPVIAQSVWLADDWRLKPFTHRFLAKYLSQKAAVCTFLSPLNTAWAARTGLSNQAELLLFGVSDVNFSFIDPPEVRDGAALRTRVLALGNDKHRDWATFSDAFLGDDRFDVRIGSRSFKGPKRGSNWLAQSCTLDELKDWYTWCDVLVIPLIANQHASGITTQIEATLMGKPVVVTDVGGLDAYFDNSEAIYTAPGDAAALTNAVTALISSNRGKAMVERAQATIRAKELTSRGYAKRHVELTRRLLARSK